MLERLCACVKEEKACVLGMPVKDTIKLTDENGKIRESREEISYGRHRPRRPLQQSFCFRHSKN